MPKLVSELSASLSSYVHPDLTFIDVLNEVLPQIASRGIWKDLTFEQSVTLGSDSRFFTLPEEADAILHAISGGEAATLKPLWNAFVNLGVTSGKAGHYFGIEDAGYVATKELLSGDSFYALYAFPNYNWNEDPELTTVRTGVPFAGTETITVEYENWEGVIKKNTTTLSASSDPQILRPRGVRSIRSIRYSGFNTSPALVVAVPIENFGLLLNLGGGTGVVTPVNELLPSLYDTINDNPADDIQIYSMIDDDATVSDNLFAPSSVSEDLITTNTIGGASTSAHPVMLLPATFADSSVIGDGGLREGTKKVAILTGSGVCRYRLFRNQEHSSNLHLLLRRALPTYTDSDEVVYLDNKSALKYAILANTAEFNNDPTQARSWWSEVERELNAELDRTLGAAHPQVTFDPSGGHGGIEAFT